MAVVDTIPPIEDEETPPSLAARLALPALLIGATALGLSGVYIKLADTAPFTTAFYRFVFAVPAFLLIMPMDRKRTPERKGFTRGDWWLLIGAGVLFAGDMAAYNFALVYTNVANSTLLGNMASIFVVLGAWLLFKEVITRGFLIGMGVAILGAVVLLGDSLQFRPEQLPGDLLSLVAALFYAAYLLCIARLRSRLSTVRIMLWSSLVGAITLVPFALAAGETMWATTLMGWAMLVALGVGAHALGQGLVAYAFAHLPASFSSVALLMQPVAAAFFAWLILAEALAPLQAAGGAVVLTGILLARRSLAKKKEKA